MNRAAHPDHHARLLRALARQLPGRQAHQRMMPRPATADFDRWNPPPDHRQAAVLVLLYPAAPAAPGLRVVLIRRPDYPGVHGGQIAFPGGAREPGESLQQTALREAHEEGGVDAEQVSVLGPLSPLYVFASNFNVHPFLAWAQQRPVFTPCAKEVAAIIELPLERLSEPRFHGEEHLTLRGRRVWVPYFAAPQARIWGATAMMLAELRDLLEDAA